MSVDNNNLARHTLIHLSVESHITSSKMRTFSCLRRLKSCQSYPNAHAARNEHWGKWNPGQICVMQNAHSRKPILNELVHHFSILGLKPIIKRISASPDDTGTKRLSQTHQCISQQNVAHNICEFYKWIRLILRTFSSSRIIHLLGGWQRQSDPRRCVLPRYPFHARKGHWREEQAKEIEPHPSLPVFDLIVFIRHAQSLTLT